MLRPRSTYLPFGRPNFTEKEIEAVVRVIRSGWIGMGPETIAFEDELARAVGASQVVTVNSCTSAIFLSLLSHKIGSGDEVICPSLTWCSTANAALYLGARPVFCDVDPATYCITPETVRAVLSPRTKAVIVVHFGRRAAEVAPLRAVLPPDVAIIEDAAHAFGATFANRQPVGSSGNLTCFSFYANKNLATGEGGAIALNDATIAGRLRSLRGRDEVGYIAEFHQDGRAVAPKYWSPNRILLEELDPEKPLNVNMNPGSAWHLNGSPAFPDQKIVELQKPFIVMPDKNGVVELTYHSPGHVVGLIGTIVLGIALAVSIHFFRRARPLTEPRCA